MRSLPLALLASLFLTACPKSDDTGGMTDADADGYGEWEDCNDRDPLIHPGAAETCDGRDNNCDGAVDEGVTGVLYFDADLDGYGAADTETTGCEGTAGYAATGDDCDDDNADVHPDADEWCDGLDNDCDDEVDEDITFETWFADEDADGYGDPDTSVEDCVEPDGYVLDDADCDDDDDEINPDADEYCDGVDNDCDGGTDEADALDTLTFYPDGDGDGFGDAEATGTNRCAADSGEVLDNTDCDDHSAAINPDATEVCDDAGADEDCDGLLNDDDDSTDPASMTPWYTDADGDGYGDPGSNTLACLQPTSTTTDDTDCDDTDNRVNPAMDEICDGADNDCDGAVDDDDAGVIDATTWYADNDGDGFGDDDDDVEACLQPTGYVADNTDCDDTDASLTDDCPVDTADPFTRNGTYDGDLEIAVTVATLGVSDTCIGTATIEVDETASTQLSGTGACDFVGVAATLLGTQTGVLDGDITSDPDAEGTVAVGSGTAIIIADDWTGEFTDDDTLMGEFSGTVVYSGMLVVYSGEFEVER